MSIMSVRKKGEALASCTRRGPARTGEEQARNGGEIMTGGEWLKDLQRAAQLTAQREQRGEQLTIGDVERTPDEPRTKPVQESAAPAAEQRGAAAQPTRRQAAPFTGRDPGRDYRRIYRALFDFHERHSPPRGDADSYWAAVCDDMTQLCQTFDNDPFLMDLTVAVFAELEREAAAQGGS